jgi:hypothetical protein
MLTDCKIHLLKSLKSSGVRFQVSGEWTAITETRNLNTETFILFGKLRMMPLQEEVDTQKGKYDDTKSDDRHYGRFSTSPAHCKSLMQKDGIKDPGDGGPYFLGSQLQNRPQ